MAQQMLAHGELMAVAPSDPSELAKTLISLVDTANDSDAIERAQQQDLMKISQDQWQITPRGSLYLNELLELSTVISVSVPA